jgi:hypothetical protein
MPRSFLVLAALAFFCISGCATRHDVVSSKMKGQGTQRVYALNVDQAWAISRMILRLEALENVEEHRAEGYMLASDNTSTLSPGTYMGVFVEAESPTSTKVTFVTRRRTPAQAYAALTESVFHRRFGELLALIEIVRPSENMAECTSADAGVPRVTLPDGGSADATSE